jgi:hypothetical protein
LATFPWRAIRAVVQPAQAIQPGQSIHKESAVTKLLLSIHVLAAILAIGPITVAASLFPRYAGAPADDGGDPGGKGAQTAAFLHRICRGYTVLGTVVPAFGVATAIQLGVLTDVWLIASVVLTAGAAILLAGGILPRQRRLLATSASLATPVSEADGKAVRSAASRLAMLTGMFNVLWAIVVVLMIVRPGSTTGA